MEFSLFVHLCPSLSLSLFRGAHNMDDHFRNMPFENNLPVMMGLTSLWNTSFLNYPALAILPYCQVRAIQILLPGHRVIQTFQDCILFTMCKTSVLLACFSGSL